MSSVCTCGLRAFLVCIDEVKKEKQKKEGGGGDDGSSRF